MKLKSLLLLLFFTTPCFGAQLSVSVHAEAAILINAETGAVLYEKNARKLHYPASTTKVATALYALKMKGNHLETILTADQDALGSTTGDAKVRSNFTLPAYWLETDGTHMGIKKGEQLSFRELMYGLMLVSANDAANMIAQHVSGTVPAFMENLNQYLKEIGCKQTSFYNPHGLHYPRHQTTAQDMATLTREALKDPFFCKIVSTVRHQRPKTNMQEPSPLVQFNMLLRSGKFYYPHAIGVKTGYHARAGHNLVAAARKDGRTLIAVLLKEKKRPELFQDAIKLFDTAFQQEKVSRTLFPAGLRKETLLIKGAVKPVMAYLKEDLVISYYPAEESKVKCLLFWDTLQPPIAKDQRLGEIKVKAEDGRIIASTTLFAKEEVKSSWSFALKSYFKQHPYFLIGTALLALAGFFYFRRA